MSENIITIYTDGSCLQNPGAGGWAAVLVCGQHRKEISGADPATTNNRMELTAAIEALRVIKSNLPVKIYSDSRYVVDGIEKWCEKWLQNNWRTAGKKPVENQDLWQELYALNAKYHVQWVWVKAHADNAENNYVDNLARQKAQQIQTATAQYDG